MKEFACCLRRIIEPTLIYNPDCVELFYSERGSYNNRYYLWLKLYRNHQYIGYSIACILT